MELENALMIVPKSASWWLRGAQRRQLVARVNRVPGLVLLETRRTFEVLGNELDIEVLRHEMVRQVDYHGSR